MPTLSTRRVARHAFLITDSPRFLLACNVVFAGLYFIASAFLFPAGNPILFALLIGGEVFHLWQVLTFIYTVWETDYKASEFEGYTPHVDVFITVAGEPVELVEQTILAARAMRYPFFTISILNDGRVANKDNWREIEMLAWQLGVTCITRTTPGGAKAGNINNALAHTAHPLVAIFDADHVPHTDFLAKTVPYLGDPQVGFVQTPQFYKNYSENYLTQSAWEQQELFFGPICKGKNRLNAATMCGTNMVLRREALLSVGGMNTESIAEDFITGLLMHARGYRSVYVPEVLAEGLATEDLLSYSKQQFRWARGALDVIFRHNPLWMRGLTFAQRIQYLSSASFYLSGMVVLIDALLPIAYFYTGAVPVEIHSMLLAAIFLPYIFFTLYLVQRTSNYTFTFPSLAFSMGAFPIHLKALWAAATFQKSAFSITDKARVQGNFISLVRPQILYIAAVIVGIPFALVRDGITASLVNNAMWGLLNIAIFVPMIRAALPVRHSSTPLPVTENIAREKMYEITTTIA